MELFYYPIAIVFYMIGGIIGYHFFDFASKKSSKPMQIASIIFLVAYILYKNNYLTVTDGLSLPTVQTIPTEGISEKIFDNTQAQFTVVQTLPNSLLVQVDGDALQGETFSYLTYYRSKQPITALKIGETNNYVLLSYRENSASPYQTLLVAKNRQTEINGNYALTYETQKTGYLTNNSKAYKFPSMDLPFLDDIEKNTSISIVGELNGLDCEYYAIAYGEQTAYIPKSHVVFFNGTPPTTQEVTIGDPQTNEDATLRLAYLLLGSVAICILVDTLILRKKNEND